MIREVRREELSDCAELIRKSFQTVADEFGFTRENAPRFTAFATTEERLIWQMESEHRLMYLDEEDDGVCGYYLYCFGTEMNANWETSPCFRNSGTEELASDCFIMR